MAFNPGYCPETLDLVMAHDLYVAAFHSNMKENFPKLGKEWGIELKFRAIHEEDIFEARCWGKNSVLESLTKDSVVIVHGGVARGEFIGIRAVRAILECPSDMPLGETSAEDARYILVYDRKFKNEVYSLLGAYAEGFPLDPKRQIGFFDIDDDYINHPTKVLARYFLQLAALRKG